MEQMQYNYVKMELTFQFFLHATQLCQNATYGSSVDMRHSYVNMQHKSVDIQHDYYVNNNKFMSTYGITMLTIRI